MYLKSITLVHFRKFGTENNCVEFANAGDYAQEDIIDISSKTTLLVGKNNSGKTTVISALDKMINTKKFAVNDFNFRYLKELLDRYTYTYLSQNVNNIELPEIECKLVISLNENAGDLLTNVIPFLTLENVKTDYVEINMKWSVKDSVILIDRLKNFIAKNYEAEKFDKFRELIAMTEYEMSFFNCHGKKQAGFSLDKLIEMTSIRANNIKNEKSLTEAFGKIVEYRYRHISSEKDASQFDTEIMEINRKLTEIISKNHTNELNEVIGQMILGDKCKVLLKADLTFSQLIKNVLKYEFLELEQHIPENQFGLGYTNLILIVAEVISYIEKFPTSSFISQINLIAIEEPETYMHPQMQELFIKNINEMMNSLLASKDKHVNSQIIISTHSSYILSSKIHLGNTFDHINYINDANGVSNIAILSDEKVIIEDVHNKKTTKRDANALKDLKYLKKHIKFKVSEIFFADAIIFVEGITEYTILQHYIDNDVQLNKYYISVLLVDGAHSKMYKGIIDLLQIPTLIITDIDIERSDGEKNNFTQIDATQLTGKTSSNTTISYFYGTKEIAQMINGSYYQCNTLMVVCQREYIENYIPTSFEEALILTNSDNQIVCGTLQYIKPDIYTMVIQNGGLLQNSFQMQMKLKDSKSDFANTLLYNILTADEGDIVPELPNYILAGLGFLKGKLGGA